MNTRLTGQVNFSKTNLGNALLRSDYHGAHLRVTQSKCPSYLGKMGILVQETLNTMVLMQPDNRSVVIPKAGCIFSCNSNQASGNFEWLLFGDQLRQHSGFRSSKKFKPRYSVAL